MDPTDPNALQAGGPPSAQQFSSMAPFMVPNTYEKLRMAMMGQPPQPGAMPPPAQQGFDQFGGGAMGYG